MTDPLALISRAERALAEATDLTELMDLRAMGKGAEAAAIALGLGDVAQRAKVFQVRAERKAGAWLADHIPHNGGGARAQAGRVTLGDLEIDHHASSRWQELAGIPEEKFHAYLDEHIARGWEVTSGGLRSYARNLSGQPVRSRPGRGIWLVPPPGICALSGYRIACSGPLEGHHLLNKSKALGNEEVRAILVACPEEIMAAVCQGHNVGRYADQPEARRILLLQAVHRFGWARMKDFFDSLPWKVPHPELTLEGLLG
jgi:hypothetical protein